MNAIVVIDLKGRRVIRKFRDDKVGLRLFPKILKRFDKPGQSTVYLVSLTHAIHKPDDYEPTRKGTYYCPFCGEERRYYPKDDGSKICPICHVSTNDFDVKNCNDLWAHITRGLSKKTKKGK